MASDAAFIRQLALSFGSDAWLYDRARPGYPDALFAHIGGRLTGQRVLEVGAGTGKATSGLISAGLDGPARPAEPPASAAALAEILDPATWPGDEIAAHPAFEYQGTSLFPWQRAYTAAEFGDFLGSTSWFRILEPELRGRLLAAITGMLQDRFGGMIGLDWSALCYNALRLG